MITITNKATTFCSRSGFLLAQAFCDGHDSLRQVNKQTNTTGTCGGRCVWVFVYIIPSQVSRSPTDDADRCEGNNEDAAAVLQLRIDQSKLIKADNESVEKGRKKNKFSLPSVRRVE